MREMKSYFYHVFSIIVIFSYIETYAQEHLFSFAIGMDYRLPTVYTNGEYKIAPDENIPGPSLGISLWWQPSDKFFVGIAQYMQYTNDFYYFKASNSLWYKNRRKILFDYKLYAGITIYLSKSKSLLLQCGVARMDVGGYSYVIDPDKTIHKFDLQHIGYNFEAAYRFKNLDFGVGFYHIPHYFKTDIWKDSEKNYLGFMYFLFRIQLFKY